MTFESRERLANTFAEMIREVREQKWVAFSEAAKATKLDPYVALARLLVREVEERDNDRSSLEN